ncbi:MAG: FAD-dependent oxidoreductase, partial [Candidatus Dojkabacteria bacterium]|nr:FAD-dependent oxidoreductase [Candidatus Dojkabacteria bacterium]
MQKYDVLVVGAGPAGMFACYELLRKRKKLKIALIDKGKRVSKRKPSEVMCGIGGAGTFSDGKLHFTAKLSHEKAFHLIDRDDYQDILDYVDEIFTKYGVNSEYYPKYNEELDNLIREATVHDLDLIVRKTRHVGSDGLKDVMLKFEQDLLKKGIDILDSTDVVDVIVRDGEVKGVLTKDEKRIYAPCVLLAPGRVGASWLQKIATKHKIPYACDKVEVGVRVEFPAPIMKRQADVLYEIVYKIRTRTYHDIVRTFCSCPNGFVAEEKYDGYICVNGYSDSSHNSKNSNFALLSEVSLTEPVENSVAYAKSIAEVA